MYSVNFKIRYNHHMTENVPSPLPVLASDASRAETTRHALLAAGFQILNEVGAEQLSLRQVAKAAKVSPMASYRYFDSKEALLAEIARLGFLSLGAAVRGPVPQDLTDLTVDHYRQMCHAYAAFASSYPAVYALMFSGVIPDHSAHPELNRDAKWSFQIVVESAQALQAVRRFREAPPLFTAYHTWSFLHGYVSLNLNRAMPRETTDSLAERLDRQVDLLIHGLIHR